MFSVREVEKRLATKSNVDLCLLKCKLALVKGIIEMELAKRRRR